MDFKETTTDLYAFGDYIDGWTLQAGHVCNNACYSIMDMNGKIYRYCFVIPSLVITVVNNYGTNRHTT